MKYLALALLLTGCTVVYNAATHPRQQESTKVAQPNCIINCTNTATTTNQEGAGTLTESITESVGYKPLSPASR